MATPRTPLAIMKNAPRHKRPKTRVRRTRFVLILILVFLIPPRIGFSLEPEEILIVANRNVEAGVTLARYYAEKRMVPAVNIRLLEVPPGETCQRHVYDQQIAAPVRIDLASRRPSGRIRCIVSMYGMPLKVAPLSSVQAERRNVLEKQERRLKELTEESQKSPETQASTSLADELRQVRRRLNEQKIESDYWAAVDSELSVVQADAAPVGGWIENPFYLGFRNRPPAIPQASVLMVSRLDGPSPAAVKRIIDDAVAAEQTGLTGIAYFDARWPMPRSAPTTGYRVYDQSVHRAAKRLQDQRKVPVVVDDADALFQPGQCPRAALYCGWYSLARYVDAFAWQQGAVGYHIASSECTTLKKPGSQVWCKRMLEEGVCATIGPVGEPYVQAFPMPEVFFGFLTEGILTLAECYMVSLPYLSWKMVLVGDPLYRPFRNTTQSPVD
jgi:uncharacterized protein (TIGR03790 family)